MEFTNFFIWLIVIGTIIGVGLGVMYWAYFGFGSAKVYFPSAIPFSFSPGETTNYPLEIAFENGYKAYQSGKYRQAISYFNQAIKFNSTEAKAYHNLGLALANLRQVNEAVAYLLKAGDLYAAQDNPSGIARIKDNLETLKANRL